MIGGRPGGCCVRSGSFVMSSLFSSVMGDSVYSVDLCTALCFTTRVFLERFTGCSRLPSDPPPHSGGGGAGRRDEFYCFNADITYIYPEYVA